MLSRLSISNYALIDSLDIEFPDGLVIISGETGAGKSILLGAISLLLGKKADTSVFNDNSRNCVVEAEFSDKQGGEYILRRVITPAGRSRSFLNDEPVTLAELTSISNKIIDIHAQHQHLLLTDPDFRLSVIDHFAGTAQLFSGYAEAYRETEKLSGEIEILEKEIAAAAAEAEYREFRLSRLKEAALVPGELAELENEQKVLANAEEIREGLECARELLSPEEMPVSQRIKDAENRLGKYASFDSRLADLAARLESCRVEIDDIASDVERICDAVVVSPQRLVAVEERLSILYSLMRKYDCASVEELIVLRDELEAVMSGTVEAEERLQELKKRQLACEEKAVALASELTARRSEVLPEMNRHITETVRSLEMPDAVFEAVLTPKAKLTLAGGDNPDFMFSANGRALRDIAKVASGGELSRVMLTLKGMLARFTALPTMIFDEIDTGVSGKIADKMGRMIGEMGQNMQIFAITHLPQIASKPGTHYLVYKEPGEDGVVHTHIRKIEGEERVCEVARMLSGSKLTAASIENAKELLSESSL